MKSILYLIWQLIWGFFQSVLGFVFFLINIKSKHFIFHGIIVTEWLTPSSVSLGAFIFVSQNSPTDKRVKNRISDNEIYQRTMVHEYGHTIQSAILGPLYLLVIGLPSTLWLTLFSKRRKSKEISYFSFYTEKWANKAGEFITKQPSMENALIE